MQHARRLTLLAVGTLLAAGTLPGQSPPRYDLILRDGLIVDGSGGPGYRGDVAIAADTLAAVGTLPEGATATRELDAAGLVVAPGFINMLSWAADALIADGRSQSDIRQGVTLEVFGEGVSYGPLNERSRAWLLDRQGDIRYPVRWTSFGAFLDTLVAGGVSPNVASFVGATTLRVNAVGFDDRAATPAELDSMRAMVAAAMAEGALGVGSSLIYAPAFFSSTEELIALCEVAARQGGMYISHVRNEGDALLESLDELIRIAAEADIRAEVYHLKQSGRDNWDKLDAVIAKIDSARAAGLAITADMYTYVAASTGLDAVMPPWVQEGGYAAWAERLREPATRARVLAEMRAPPEGWENNIQAAGSADKVMLVGFRADSLKYLTGRTLGEVARMRGTSPEETAMDLVIQDGSRVQAIYFLMDEANVRRQVTLPWMSFGSDAGSQAPEGVFLQSSTHPRAYGNFARLLAKYVREESALTLEEAVRKLSGLPAENLRLTRRGLLRPGYYADLAVFDPATIQDHATFAEPQQLATGMVHVFVNGEQVLCDGEHTGALPGRVVRGPGWRGE